MLRRWRARREIDRLERTRRKFHGVGCSPECYGYPLPRPFGTQPLSEFYGNVTPTELDWTGLG